MGVTQQFAPGCRGLAEQWLGLTPPAFRFEDQTQTVRRGCDCRVLVSEQFAPPRQGVLKHRFGLAKTAFGHTKPAPGCGARSPHLRAPRREVFGAPPGPAD